MFAYEVIPISPYGNRIAQPVYVRAHNATQAAYIGKDWLRLMGVKGKFYAKAYLYNPLEDLAMRGFVRAV